jgi:predicted nucleotidyltransferase
MGDEAATGARETLKELAAAIESHFRSELLGLYLFGSLAAGGFYPGKSDLDLMAIIAAEVEEGSQLEELRSLHDTFVSERPTWVERIEVAYVDRGVLRTFGDRPRGRIAVVCPGEPLHIRDAGLEVTLDWHGVITVGETILGPPPLDLGPPVSRSTLPARGGNAAERVADQSACVVGRVRSGAPGVRRDDAVPRSLCARHRRASDEGGGGDLGRSQIPGVVALHQRSPRDVPRGCA